MKSGWEIVKSSIRLAWKYKILWIFSLLVSAGAPQINYRLSEFSNLNARSVDMAAEFREINFIIYILIFLLVFSVFLVFSLLTWIIRSAWSDGSLIYGSISALKSHPMNLREMSKTGIRFMGKLITVRLIVLGTFLLVQLFLLLILGLIIAADAGNMVFIFGFIFVAVSLYFLFGLIPTWFNAQRLVVLKNYKPQRAVEMGLRLFKESFKESVLEQLKLFVIILPLCLGALFLSGIVSFILPPAGLAIFLATMGFSYSVLCIAWTKYFLIQTNSYEQTIGTQNTPQEAVNG